MGQEQDLSAWLASSSSAIFFLAEDMADDRVFQALGQYGATVLRTSLSTGAEYTLKATLSQEVAA